MLSLFVSIVISAQPSPTLALPQPTDPEEFRRSAHRVNEHLSALESSATQLLGSLPELAGFMHALREKNSVAWEKDESSLHDRFPAAYLIWPYKGYRFEGFETGQGALKEKLEERIAEFREMRGCAESLMDGGSAPRSCQKVLGCPHEIGSDDRGLYRVSIEEDYEPVIVRVTKPLDALFDSHRGDGRTDAFARIKEHVGGVVFEGCRLVRLLDPVREPLSATLNWKHFSKADVDVAVFQDVCTRRPDDHPLQTRLKELAARFPKAKDITEALQATPTYCKAGAVQWCRTMRKTGDKWEVAYYDGCTEKRATSDDLRLEASSAPKEAGRSQLDARSLPMNACAAAHQLGYEWSFDSPVPPESCHGPEDEVALLERISEHRWRLVGEEEAARFKMGPRMTDLSTAVAGVLGPTWQRVGDTEAQRIARGHGLSDVFAAYVPRERRGSAVTEFVVLRASRRLVFDDSFERAATKSEPDVLCSEAGLSSVAGSVGRYDADRKALWCEGAVTTPRGREGRVSMWQHDGWHVVLLDGYAKNPAAARRLFGRAFQQWSERASNVYSVTQTSGYPRSKPASWLRGGWMNLKWGMGPGDMFSRVQVSTSGPMLEQKSTGKKSAQVFTFHLAEELYDEPVKAKTFFFGGRLAVIEVCPAGTPDTNALRWYSDLKGGLTEKYGPPGDTWASDDDEKCYGVQWFAGQTRIDLSHCPTLHKNIPVCVTYTDLSLGRDHSKERDKL